VVAAHRLDVAGVRTLVLVVGAGVVGLGLELAHSHVLHETAELSQLADAGFLVEGSRHSFVLLNYGYLPRNGLN